MSNTNDVIIALVCEGCGDLFGGRGDQLSVTFHELGRVLCDDCAADRMAMADVNGTPLQNLGSEPDPRRWPVEWEVPHLEVGPESTWRKLLFWFMVIVALTTILGRCVA